MANKVTEALEHIKAAEKYLKTTLMRWKPDLDSAAHEYTQAAQCYRIARDQTNSKNCHLKAAECYQKNRAFFHAAKALENAIIVAKDFTTPDEMYRLAMESANLYQQHGSGDAAASVLDKTGRILEVHFPERAVELFQQAANASTIESSQHQGAEYIGKATRILIRLQWYNQAVNSIRREIMYHLESGNTGAVGRLTMAIVLVQLARGDTVAAEKAYREWGNNCEAPEMQTIEDLLLAFDEEDQAGARRALGSPFIRNMDVEYARLAANIPLPEGLEPAPRGGVIYKAAASYKSPYAAGSSSQGTTVVEQHAPKKPDDDGGLC